MGATLGEEMQRALATLAEIASARAIVARAPAAERGERRGRSPAAEGELGG
jgi:hypothetical protein